MLSLYLPYTVEFDAETRTYCISGLDGDGRLFGVGADASVEGCERRLHAYILDVLDAHASQGEDRFGDLHTSAPDGPYVAFGPTDLLPIRLKLARNRAKLRQADLAERLGITQQAYAKFERPGANLTLRTIALAEQTLGVQLLSLVLERPTSGKRKKTYENSLRSRKA